MNRRGGWEAGRFYLVDEAQARKSSILVLCITAAAVCVGLAAWLA